ncbi:succinate dehydrogenase [Loktanella sp. D2R18]|uniref:succinate dehydrogenase n=1 Tax=Rhodobacterales TaxID=204455 RepID=UPI000DE87882|nr:MULTISPECIES: succinate dehydrogenase [Rhodobacterales]MDO6588690.1 succinate dehydrogenase [Yoonia sp. 1_MG-2023]RBW42065.1 succinate dehydrogenase [Loktanella sp. D2R18]
MWKYGLIAAAAFGLSGCLDASDSVDQIARSSAKTVVNGVVESKFPGVDATPVTDCIIDNASSSEIVEIAQAAVVGTTSATTDLVVEIAGRPDTISCIADDTLGVGDLLSVFG